MEHKILIVDDNTDFLATLVEQFKSAQNIFDMVTAENGAEALDVLKCTPISLVVSDVQMPVMDGFILMAYVAGLYPDLPIIMMNDAGEVGAEEAALESGAVAYLEKPFTPKDLLRTISDTLEKMSDGGQLSNISLEMFIQLFEMEEKTCTARVVDKDSNQSGTLFFIDGVLTNARTNIDEGNEAAYEIISWENISVSISDTCFSENRTIDEDIQSIMFEAGRRREQKQGTNSAPDKEQQVVKTQEGESLGTSGTGGGKLTNVSLEVFLQLFEMEEKTCTLTIENQENNTKGVLFFIDGELMDAKLNYISGTKAGLEILSWEKVSIEIGYDSSVSKKNIDGDLQGLLLEAMRLRDEADLSEDAFKEEETPFYTPPKNSSEPATMTKKTPKNGQIKKIWSKLTKRII
jgi:CheY-like chemotaxis protein